MNIIKKSLAIICTLSVVLMLIALPVSAVTVSYDDAKEQFVFDTEGGANPTDLFVNFKDAMPGDTLSQTIMLENKSTNRMNVKVFMRSLGANADSNEFLSKLKLTVNQEGYNPFFEAPANQVATLGDWVELGNIATGGSVKLNVLLEIPITLGNDFMDKIGTLKWEFMSEEQPIDMFEEYCPKHHKPYYVDVVTEDGVEYAVFHCEDCGDEFEYMRCEICGSKMRRVLTLGADGKYYYYYECISPEKHHTTPSPVTGEFFDLTFYASLLTVAFLGISTAVVFISRKNSRVEEQ